MNERRSNITASVVIHVLLFAFFWGLTALFPGHEPEPAPIDVVFYKPPPREPAPPPPVVPDPEPEPEPERPKAPPPPEPEVEIAELEPPPPPEPVVKPKPEPKPEPVVAKVQQVMEARPKREVITKPALQQETEPAKPRRPKREVKTALLNAAAIQPATRLDDRPRKKATTGAFGNTDKKDPNPPSRNLRGGTPKVGGFQVAEHTAPAAQKPSRTISRNSGFGNSDPGAETGHARGGGGGDATVSTGGFGSTAKAERPRTDRKVKTEKPDTPVEILSKPTPTYTAEAREMRVEGEVALRVTFQANGEIRVLEVIDGLGHGLDEAAMEAAKHIRFKPARRERQPVDHTTVLRIVFQLV